MGIVLLAVFGGGGLLLAGTGVAMLARRLRARWGRPTVVGEIAEWESVRVSRADRLTPRSRGPRLRTGWTPYVTYTAADGHQHTARVAFQYASGYRKRHPTGSALAVFPDPTCPERAYPASLADTFVLPCLMTAAGTLVVLLALGMAFGAPTT